MEVRGFTRRNLLALRNPEASEGGLDLGGCLSRSDWVAEQPGLKASIAFLYAYCKASKGMHQAALQPSVIALILAR